MSGLFKPRTPKVAAPEPKPKPMPDEEDPRVLLAKKNTMRRAMGNSGQMSTILNSNTRETLGAG
jgi:hypothetical protein